MGGEEVCERGLEEVVGKPVDVQDGAVHGFSGLDVAADEDGHDAAFTVRVGAKVENMLAVAVTEDVGLPVRAAHEHLHCGEGAGCRAGGGQVLGGAQRGGCGRACDRCWGGGPERIRRIGV